MIAFSGVEADGLAGFLNEIKEKIENMQIKLTEEERQQFNLETNLPGREAKGNECNEVAIPKLNFVISSYYKGTGLEEVLKKLEEYLDHADSQESDITNL